MTKEQIMLHKAWLLDSIYNTREAINDCKKKLHYNKLNDYETSIIKYSLIHNQWILEFLESKLKWINEKSPHS